MDFEAEEKAILDDLRQAPERPGKSWLVIVILGAGVCVLSLVLLFSTRAELSFCLLSLVAGLVVISRGLERRRRAILAQILRKYEKALRDP
jgi:hypothetical protein